MRRYLPIYLLLLISLGLSTGLIFKNRQSSNMTRELIKTINTLSEENSILTILNRNRNSETLLNGQKIYGHIADLKCIESDLNSIDNDKLCFFFSSDHCLECIQTELFNLRESAQFDPEDIMLLLSTSDMKFAKTFANNNSPDFATFIVCDDFNPLITKQQNPFYFVIEKQGMRINSLFFPAKEDIALTKSFFQDVYIKYFLIE